MSHPDKLNIYNQNNQQAIANDTRWKKQIILYTRATHDFIPLFLEYKSEWKTSSQKTPNVENKGSDQRNQEPSEVK